MKSIQFRILAAFLLVSLVPLSALTIYMFNSMEEQLILKEKESMTEVVSETGKRMDQWLEKQMEMLNLLAKTKEIKSENIDEMLPIMAEFKSGSSVFETAFYVKPDGYVFAHTTQSSIGSNYADRTYIQKALKGEANFSDVLVSKATGNPIVVIATPVTKDGEIVGVLASSINFNEFVVEFTAQGDQIGEMYLIDNLNVVRMSSNNKEFIGKNIDEISFNPEIKNVLANKADMPKVFDVISKAVEEFIFYAPVSKMDFGIYWSVHKADVVSIFKPIKIKMLMPMLATSLFVVIIAFILAKGITRPLKIMVDRIKDVAHGDGDLTKRLEANSLTEINQLSQNINAFIENIHGIVARTLETVAKMDQTMREVNQVVEQSEKHTYEIHKVIDDVNRDFSIQADNTQNASNAVEEIAIGINRIAENAGRVSEYSVQANIESKNGNDTIVKAMEQMQLVSDYVAESSEKIKSLGEKSNDISNIVAVITDIAEQTNLLALNAAIEAARAGEHGKGFAVVAEEVRKLADQSKQSADDIIALIASIQVDAEASVTSMEIVSKETNNGLSLVEDAGSVFSTILERMQNVANDIQEVSAAAEEITAGTEEASASIQGVSLTAEHTKEKSNNMKLSIEEESKIMLQLSSAVDSLEEVGTELKAAINRFKV
ncbi:MAG TPA: HAMP domain-containing protein [Bacillus bacterium]|nr:HAMP domain-containing protein [Bacillus sp. (in: firmicutes)]